MKAIFSFLIIALFFASPVKSQSATDLKGLYDNVLRCQASYKIAAYYVDIYKTMNRLIEKKDPDSSSDLILKKLQKEWNLIEDFMEPIKRLMIEQRIDLDHFDKVRYPQLQVELLQNGFELGPNKFVPDLMGFVNQCQDVNKNIEKFLKGEKS